MRRVLALLIGLALVSAARAEGEMDRRFPLFASLTSPPTPRLVAYTPSQLDPRNEANQRRLLTSSIRADLKALRPAFDGLVLYGYHEACTPRILAVAKDLDYRVVLLAIWDVKSAREIDGVAALCKDHEGDFKLGVLVGNEGITFKRYEADDLKFAAARLRRRLPKTVPIGTSEPLVGYKHDFIREFGDFLAPNIHPFFDRPKMSAAEGAGWAREEAAALAKKTGKPVILKETGLPHAGRADCTPAAQKAFWEAYTKPGLLARPKDAKGAWVYYGVGFEAFDLPWKAEESKLAVEKSWGLLSPKREAYPALAVWKALGKEK